MRMLGGQFVPVQGSGCDTGLKNENGSQKAADPMNHRFVKKITGNASPDRTGEGGFFVKKIANTQKPRESDISRLWKGESQPAGRERKRGQKPVPISGFRLARMLLPEALAMIADFFTTMTFGRYMMAAPQQPAVTPRGLYTTPSFFVFDFFRESLHKSVGTQRRPHRGGKEGSVCRVM